jgi:UDP-2,3-diacylglucosamine pyrophosphatase LpxH
LSDFHYLTWTYSSFESSAQQQNRLNLLLAHGDDFCTAGFDFRPTAETLLFSRCSMPLKTTTL